MSNDHIPPTEDDAATPLTREERADLIPAYITLKQELNEAEQIGIDEADRWAFSRKRDVLSDAFLLGLHRRMFKDVWRWAGSYRKTERNIGVDHWLIAIELKQMLDDTRFWIDNHVYTSDEIAIRFHHRLVLIHPFPNGNGRHARLAADLLIVMLGGQRFSWGRASLISAGQTRQAYIAALRQADRYDVMPLLSFARS